MPVLMKWPRSREVRPQLPVGFREEEGSSQSETSLFPVCANLKCRSGRIRLWRKRDIPLLEGRWACSPVCMQVLVEAAIQREIGDGAEKAAAHQHRVPLGLGLLSRGIITHEQLKKALAAQRKVGAGRLGEWLIEQGAVSEEQVTRALAAQWNVPVLSGDSFDPAAMAVFLPRLLVDSFSALPLRRAGRKLLYVAFEDRVDRRLQLSMEQTTGLKVEAGFLPTSIFRKLRGEMLQNSYPNARLLEASGVRGLVHAMAGVIEERKPADARIVRVHDYLWLRMWLNPAAVESDAPRSFRREDVEDMICSLNLED